MAITNLQAQTHRNMTCWELVDQLIWRRWGKSGGDVFHLIRGGPVGFMRHGKEHMNKNKLNYEFINLFIDLFIFILAKLS